MNMTPSSTLVSIGRSLWLFNLVILFSILIPHSGSSDNKQSHSTEPVAFETAAVTPLPENEPERIQDDAIPAENETTDVSFQLTSGKEAERLFHPFIIQAASRYEVDPLLIKAIIMAESEYNPNALSKVGAKGLMQLMPITAKELGVEDIYNPEQNIDGGVRYFKKLLTRFDEDIELALAAYNAGSRYVRKYQGVPPFKATQRYIKKVCKFYEDYKEQTSWQANRV